MKNFIRKSLCLILNIIQFFNFSIKWKFFEGFQRKGLRVIWMIVNTSISNNDIKEEHIDKHGSKEKNMSHGKVSLY